MNIQDLLKYTNNIDKLFSDKVQDHVLIEELPLGIKIGEKTIYIGNFTLENNFKFFNDYGKLMAHLGLKYINFDHLGDGAELYALCLKNKAWFKGMLKIIKSTILKQQAFYYNKSEDKRKEIKWTNCSVRYFKKNVTTEGLMQICKLVHLYNFDAEKKNFKILLGGNPTISHMETYMYNWLQNCPGLTGKFQLALYPKPESLDKEFQSLKEDSKTKKTIVKDDV